MIKKIIVFAILVVLTTWLHPIFEVILPYPSQEFFAQWLESDSEIQAETALWAMTISRYVVWIIALAAFLKYFPKLFGMVVPISASFGTTKLVRRLRWFYFELSIILFYALLLVSVTVINPSIRQYDTALEKERVELAETYYLSLYSEKYELQDDIRANRSNAEAFVNKNDDKYTVYSGIWPLDEDKSIDDYSSDTELPGVLDRITSWFSDGGDIRNTSEYRSFFVEQKSLTRRLRKVNANELDDRSIDRRAEAIVNGRLGNPLALVLKKAKRALWWIIPLSLLFYAPTTYYLPRFEIGKRFERVKHFWRQKDFGQGGSARFAGMIEEWALLFNKQDTAVFLGRSLFNPFSYLGLSGDRGMLTFAAARAFKGVCVIIPNLLKWKHSVMCIDPKGTNAVVCARGMRESGKKVHIIDPFHITGEVSARLNILEFLDLQSPTIREDIMILAEAMIIRPPGEKNPHWSDSAQMVLAGKIAHLISSEDYTNPHLGMVRDMVTLSPNEYDKLIAKMAVNHNCGGLARDAAMRIIKGFETEEITNIISNVDKHTHWLSSPAIQETMKRSTFSFDELKEKPTGLFIVLPPHMLNVHNRFLRLFVNFGLREMSKGGKSRTPVMFMLDEFLALKRMTELETALPLLPGYNLLLWPIAQHLDGLIQIYGEHGVEAFIANSRAIQGFGLDGERTKKFFSSMLDKKKLPNGQIVELRTPSEVSREVAAHTGMQYILRAGNDPLILEKVKYFDSAPFPRLRFLSKLPFIGKYFTGIFDGLYDQDPDYE